LGKRKYWLKNKVRRKDMAIIKEKDKERRYVKGITYIFLFGVPILFLISYFYDCVWLTWVSVAAFGGIIHDLIQNNGVIAYAHRTKEGIRLGVGLGAIIGGICGLFAFAVTHQDIVFTVSYFFSPFLIGFPDIPPQAYSFTATDLFTPFVSGLAFKGIADAIGAKGATRSEQR
jgi:hypothetical protein